MKTFTNTDGELCFSLNHGKNEIAFPHIKYIKSLGNYSSINLASGETLVSSFTLKFFSNELLKQSNFFLTNRGFLINLDFVETLSYDKGYLLAMLINEPPFSVSRRKGQALLEHIKTHCLGLNVLNEV